MKLKKNQYKLICTIVFLIMTSISFAMEQNKIEVTKVTINKESSTLTQIFQQISSTTDIDFSYGQFIIENTNKYRAVYSNTSLKLILEELGKMAGFGYQIQNDNIIITRPSKAPEKTDNQKAQQKVRVSGMVTDQVGVPIPGANVVEEGTTNGISTDFDGKYSIEVNYGATLNFSFLGFQTQQIKVGNQTSIDVQLITDTNELDEVVVVGYGTQKKRDLTGAISTLDGEKIQEINGTQLSQELQGQLPGVTVTRNSSVPGASATIRIRGITTIGDSDPLIIVDGVPYTNINDITSNDIESITVLKDAASASIYGARAAAGVILITTKTAKKGKTSIEIGANTGFESIPTFPQSVDVTRYLQMANEAMWNDAGNPEGGEYPLYSQDDVEHWVDYNKTDPNNYPITDWIDLLIKDYAPRQRSYINFNHGGETVQSRVSVNYENTEAMYHNRNYERIIARANNRFSFGENVTVDFDVSLNQSNSNSPLSNPINSAHKYAPIYAAMWEDGRIAGGKDGSNRYADIMYGGSVRGRNSKMNGRISMAYEPLDGLTFTGTISPYFYFSKEKTFNKVLPWYDADDPTILGGYISGHNQTNLYELRSEVQSLTKQFVVNWKKQFDVHNLSLMGGYEDYYYKNEVLNAQSEDLELSGFPYLDLGNQNFVQNSGNEVQSAYRSLFGRLIYDYDSRYFLQANFRYDGSSRFHSDHRWGFFPSISVGWDISQENFMKDISAISLLKLKGSFGSLGNERIGYYPYQSSINYGSVPLYQGGSIVSKTTAAQIAYAIQDISWETTESWNIGIDGSFFNSRLNASADYYVKNTKDMLLELEVPDYLGYNNPNQNTGTMETKGWEFVVSWNDRLSDDFSYSASFNISDFTSTMGDLGGTVFTGDQIIRKGSEFNEWYGYVSDGLFQTQEEVDNSPLLHNAVRPGDIRYKDISGPDGVPDGAITPEYDKVLLGSSLPHYTYGANLNFVYKDFDLGLVFQGVGEQNVRLEPDMIQPFESWWTSPSTLYDGNYWSVYNTPEENLKAPFPRLSHQSAENNNYEMSDYWMFDGGYFRLKNITLGYNLPQSVLDRMNISKIRIYVSGTDLFSISDFPKGYDAEALNNTYISSIYSLGVNINF